MLQTSPKRPKTAPINQTLKKLSAQLKELRGYEMGELPKYLNGLEVRRIIGKEIGHYAPDISCIINEYMYDGRGDDKEIEHAYFSKEGSHICLFDGPEIAAYAKMIRLPETNTAYFSMLACNAKHRKTGLFSSSLMLSVGQGLEWDSSQVACVTANNRVLEKFYSLKFIHDSGNPNNVKLAQKIALERWPGAEVINGFILNGEILESYPNVPYNEPAKSDRINRMFDPPFERKRCDRRLMFRRIDSEAVADYSEWLSAVIK